MTLKVLYITIQFPVPSETFAAVEIRALQQQGVKLSVTTLKPAARDCASMLDSHGLSDTEIDHSSPLSFLRGLCIAARHPSLFYRLIKSVTGNGTEVADKPGLTPRQPSRRIAPESREYGKGIRREAVQPSLLKNLALILRSLDIFHRIRRSPPDIVHLYWGHYPSLAGLLVHELLDNVTLSLSLSAYDLHSRYPPSIELARKAPLVFTLAQANTPEIERFGVPKERIQVIYHGIDIEELPPGQDMDKSLDVVIVERLVPAKCTADSLRVFQRVLESWPTARLTVVGDGPERSKLENLVHQLKLDKTVRFLGHIDHQEAFKQFSASKVLLSMSLSERLPNTVKEAMLRGCIPVVAHTVGIEELIRDQETGFIVEQGDIDQAADSVVRCLREWKDLSGLRTAARHHIVENFSSNAVARKRRKIWEEAIRGHQDRA